jgi:hypothetical protein
MTLHTVREELLGTLTLRLVATKTGFSGVVLGKAGKHSVIKEGTDPDEVWGRLIEEAGKIDSQYVGYAGARKRFHYFFPGGFASQDYAANERTYKLAAKAKLDATLPLAEAATGSGMGEAALAAFQATNLLSIFEKAKLAPVLRGPSADIFVRAAARFAFGGGASALSDMAAILRPHDSAKWTVVTYLPFLWRPDTHMFLKPMVMQDFARSVGHRFKNDYTPDLDMGVYDSLLDLAAKTEAELVDVHPQDRIDVQSFIWVVGCYKDEHHDPQP